MASSMAGAALGGGDSGVELALRNGDGVELAPAADASTDLLTLAREGRAGLRPRPPLLAAIALTLWVAAVGALVLPWALALAAERALSRARGVPCALCAKRAAWWLIDFVWDDAIVLACALLPASYGQCVWALPPALTRGACAVTVDDAPGRDPEAMEALLDVLRAHDARVTFFVTTDYAEGLVDDAHTARLAPAEHDAHRERVWAALVRAVREGHELANHMPADMPYARMCARDEAAFCAELERAERVLERCRREAAASAAPAAAAPATALPTAAGAPAPAAAGAAPAVARSVRWYRPPSAVLSTRMAALLRARGYAIAICDAYSADPWIDGGAAPAPAVVEFHAAHLARRLRAGSIAVVHTPERACRRQSIEALARLLPRLRAKGLRARTLSEVAAPMLSSVAADDGVAASRDETSNAAADRHRGEATLAASPAGLSETPRAGGRV